MGDVVPGFRFSFRLHLDALVTNTSPSCNLKLGTCNLKPLFHTTASGHRIAYQHQAGEGMGVVFLAGYRSDMESTKAAMLAEHCADQNIPFTRFDYFAHGQSDGDFIDYEIGKALDDTLTVLDDIAVREVILVGSSMGGWLGLLAAIQRPQQVRGFVGVAAAPDFTERLMYKKMLPEQRREIEEKGVLYLHSEYFDNDYPVTLQFIHEARQHLLLDHPIPLSIPIHLLQGQRDEDVPWELALQITEKLVGDDVTVTLIKDGDHRLNRPQDLALLSEAVHRIRTSLRGA